MLEIEFMAAKAERDRLQESARMHTEAAIVVNEKAEKVRTPTLQGGLGRVIQEVSLPSKGLLAHPMPLSLGAAAGDGQRPETRRIGVI